ncbi:valine--tRNA ligase [Sphingomonas sanguinis]|jgi:valyl-tRNA synthetase|uniref:Valine--tRNA ligase n=1 Tax=Sphingomonas sanguinis TaxID=33051 RepID=A0A7Y7QVN2_9SPHN|nr:valine--tRNA ligase [Sphingomonas sanguinis]MBZ6382272.1 valine--tRNA ligase [Sphingomonas sanguinis]NNG50858.1 valine--tRNA ligase [Sphingomonas sanguinis]NNG54354.1 valine--tRNA ligase [Sphingomonas sanguinis]NVP31570.1 valine--tRNA ligase [Sphingomonas sanguinis]
MTELPKTFDPAAIEARWYGHWEEKGLFRPDRPNAEPWTIVNPPPNVTGNLHIGHALDNTLQDILVRHARLKGKDALWVVGTDHAGIATQMVVERQMNARGEKRTDFTRDQFLEKVWTWKAESGGQITGQLRRLGCSMDWANERFTMDEGFSKAVLKVFVELHRQKLLYRDKRLVNWDAGLGTAISDLEVETREVKGSFWRLRYPLADGSGFIEVATTRPETMLADMAVAVHPDDARYTAMIGKQVRLPITGRLIPIVADEHADPELGSGAVKITPGHDFNDFEVGRRAGIEARDMLNMLDGKARICQTSDGLIPDAFLGLSTAEARKAVVARLKDEGVLIPHIDKDGEEHDAEPRTIQTPFGDRSGVVIEPWLTDQWYVDAKTLAQPAIEAVRSGKIKIVPQAWEKTFFNWMENIQPWCVSRQLWWGHQIPAWFAKDGRVFVAESEEEAQAEAGEGVTLTRDPDVLDTWFSSALWPFATLGWPDNGDKTLAGRYPNDVLISGFDILFFWDARMMMQGMHFMEDVPFKTLYLHGLVRAADGSKMSKSKGNTVDPLGLIDQYGADALRFFMAAMESQGRDIKMDERRVEGYRNFATKLWNAARFAQANGIGASTTLEAPNATLAVNKWIIAETVKTVQAVDLALADYRFDGAANAIYQFVWSRFCDWYLELIKPVLQGGEEGGEETRAVAGWVLDQILVLLHPFMPFITEELWHAMGARDHDLIVAQWPMADARALDPEAEREIDWLIRLVSEIRAARTELNVPPGARLPMHVRDANEGTTVRLTRQASALARLARVDSAEGEVTGGAAQVVVDEATFVLPLEGVIDLDAERQRLTKAIAAVEKERDALGGRLSNASFVERAKPEAVEKARADHADKMAEAARLHAALGRLG